VIVERVDDVEIIKSIMLHPEIWPTISEDNFTQEEYEPDVYVDFWLGAFVDGDCIGLFRFHSLNGVTVQIHIQILPEYREKFAMESVKHMWKWLLDQEDTPLIKVVASIPIIYPNVIKFALANGFKEEGINRMSYKKNGKIVDQLWLGITKEEIKGEI